MSTVHIKDRPGDRYAVIYEKKGREEWEETHPTLHAAEIGCQFLNAERQALGLSARYSVKEIRQ